MSLRVHLFALYALIGPLAWGSDPGCFGPEFQRAADRHDHLDALLSKLYSRLTERESAVVIKYWIYDGLNDAALCKKLSLSEAELEQEKKTALNRLFQLEPKKEKRARVRAQAEVLVRRLLLKGARPERFPSATVISFVPPLIAGEQYPLVARVAAEFKIELLEGAEEPIATRGRILRGLLFDGKSDDQMRAELGMDGEAYQNAKDAASIRFNEGMSKVPGWKGANLAILARKPAKISQARGNPTAQEILAKKLETLRAQTAEANPWVADFLDAWLIGRRSDEQLEQEFKLNQEELSERKHQASGFVRKLLTEKQKRLLFRKYWWAFDQPPPKTMKSPEAHLKAAIEKLQASPAEKYRRYGKFLNAWLMEKKSDQDLQREFNLDARTLKGTKQEAIRVAKPKLWPGARNKVARFYGWPVDQSAPVFLNEVIEKLKSSSSENDRNDAKLLNAWLVERKTDQELQNEFNVDVSGLKKSKQRVSRVLMTTLGKAARIRVQTEYRWAFDPILTRGPRKTVP